MRHLTLKDLDFPAGLNLGILAAVLSPDDLGKLILENHSKLRKDRRIILPSLRTCRKIYAHAIWKKILSGKLTWEKYKEDLQKEHGSMLMVGIEKDRVIEFYKNREKEIKKEKK